MRASTWEGREKARRRRRKGGAGIFVSQRNQNLLVACLSFPSSTFKQEVRYRREETANSRIIRGSSAEIKYLPLNHTYRGRCQERMISRKRHEWKEVTIMYQLNGVAKNSCLVFNSFPVCFTLLSIISSISFLVEPLLWIRSSWLHFPWSRSLSHSMRRRVLSLYAFPLIFYHPFFGLVFWWGERESANTKESLEDEREVWLTDRHTLSLNPHLDIFHLCVLSLSARSSSYSRKRLHESQRRPKTDFGIPFINKRKMIQAGIAQLLSRLLLTLLLLPLSFIDSLALYILDRLRSISLFRNLHTVSLETSCFSIRSQESFLSCKVMRGEIMHSLSLPQWLRCESRLWHQDWLQFECELESSSYSFLLLQKSQLL